MIPGWGQDCLRVVRCWTLSVFSWVFGFGCTCNVRWCSKIGLRRVIVCFFYTFRLIWYPKWWGGEKGVWQALELLRWVGVFKVPNMKQKYTGFQVENWYDLLGCKLSTTIAYNEQVFQIAIKLYNNKIVQQ